MNAEYINIIIGLVTGGGLVTGWVAWKTRNSSVSMVHSEAKGKEVTALEGMQNLYDKFVEQTNKRFDEYDEIIEKLKKDLRDQITKCKNCVQ